MPNKLDFPKGKGSNIHIIVYIPSTKNINAKIPNKEFKKRISSVTKFMRTNFGGSTRVAGIGNYYSSDLGMSVSEKVAKVETFTTKKDYYKVDIKIKRYLIKKKKEWSQESIGYQFNGSMYFV